MGKTIDAIKHSLRNHPYEWEFECSENVSSDHCWILLHRLSRVKLGVPSSYAAFHYWLFSPRAKEWERSYDRDDPVTGWVDRLTNIVADFRRNLKDEDIGPAFVEKLKGTTAPFTNDAKALAQAVLAERIDAVWPLIDEIQDTQRR